MNNFILNKGKGMRFITTSSSLPTDLDYNTLEEEYNKPTIKDLRKMAHTHEYSLDQIDNTRQVDKLTKDTIIPVPGLLINHEDSQQGTEPRPTDGPASLTGGPQWGGEY